MKAPLSWIKDFVEIPDEISADEIVKGLVKIGFEVEDVISTGLDLSGPIIVAKVLSIEELSGHKKPIRFVQIDCGGSQSRYVICGARNFSEGDLVVAALPGSILPRDFAITSRETYGKISDGMICSAKELAMSDNHDGIIVLPLEAASLGDNAIELLQLKDEIFDIAVNPDRGYALSIRGLARELAGALNLTFVDPINETLKRQKEYQGVGLKDDQKFEARITTGADLLHIRRIENLNLQATTPLWLSRRLEKSGMRSISLAVDITNYIMLELGQPLHAFDSEKVKKFIEVRAARKGEVLQTLDKMERELDTSNLVIADASGPLALAGTMGGLSSEVSGSTHSILIEAAHFHPIAIARNSRSHKISTEASRRFERGVDSSLPEIASLRAAFLLSDLADGDLKSSAFIGEAEPDFQFTVSHLAINQLIGYSYSVDQCKDALDKIGAKHQITGDEISITAPSWRPDLKNINDLAEEIARISGYELIPMKVAYGKEPMSSPDLKSGALRLRRKKQISEFLAAKGFSESANYPFTSDDFIRSLGFTGDRAKTFKLANPISEEFPVLRTHILQSLFPTVMRNLNRGAKNVALFEMGSVFRNTTNLTGGPILSTGARPKKEDIERVLNSVPHQPLMVAGVIAGNFEAAGWWGKGRSGDWLDAIFFAEEIVKLCGSEVGKVASDLAPWHPGRCAELQVAGRAVAHAGELHPKVIELLELPARSVAFAVLIDAINPGEIIQPSPLATMPPGIQDIALIVDNSVVAAELESALIEGAGPYLEKIELFDRYDKIGEGKISLAYTLTFRAPARTLKAEEIADFRSAAVSLASKRYGAVLREG